MLIAGFGKYKIRPANHIYYPMCMDVFALTNFHPSGTINCTQAFQKRMSQLLSGWEGIVCQMDYVLIFGTTREQHNAKLADALERICSAGVTLNRESVYLVKTA